VVVVSAAREVPQAIQKAMNKVAATWFLLKGLNGDTLQLSCLKLTNGASNKFTVSACASQVLAL